jgi:hypothetical protein
VAIDWEAKAGAPNVAVFGEPATFTPASGDPAFDVVGVFDNQFRSTTLLSDDAPTSDRLPVFGVNESQFLPTASVPTKARPVQNDRVTFPATAKHEGAGKTYLVKEPRPDNHGIFHLVLNEAAA